MVNMHVVETGISLQYSELSY